MKIIIIGAGISGLTIAHELVEKNFDIEISNNQKGHSEFFAHIGK